MVGLKTSFKAIVYIQRNKALNNLKELKEKGIVIINVIGDLLSNRASKDKELVTSMRELHIDPYLEHRIFRSAFKFHILFLSV